MNNWEKLSLKAKSELISIYLKNGITSLDEMKKHYNSFAEGGNTDIPPERFFGIATPEITDNNIYYSRNSLLPEVSITAKGDSRKVNNDYYKAHSRVRADLQSRVADRTDQGWVPKTMLGLAALPFAVEGAAALAPTVGRVLANPLVDAALTTHGVITAPKNIKEGISEIKEGNYGTGTLDLGLTALDVAGGFGLVRNGIKYVNTVKPRLAEVLLSAGDALMNKPIETSKRLVKNRKALSYIFNPWEKPSTAYELGPYFNYSGTEALPEPMVNKKTGEILILDGNSSRYPGDVLDLFLGKNLDKARFPLTKEIPKGITNYTQSRYSINNPRVYDLGIVDNEANAVQTESMGIYKNGRPVLDPGHHKTYGKNDIGTLHYDIWKYNPDDFEKRWIKSDWPKWKRIAAKKAAAFVDAQGEPIAHIWTQPYGTGLVNDSPTLSSPLLKDLGITDMDLQHILKSPPSIIQLANGGKIHIKPENRGKFTALKKRTGHSASWFKENGTPAQRKMAVFELNSKKWRK